MNKPSEKAMHRAHEWLEAYEGDYVPEGDQVIKECLALQFDAHTAEAIAEHQRVLEIAEKSLQSAEYAIRGREHTGFIDKALAEIAKLRKE